MCAKRLCEKVHTKWHFRVLIVIITQEETFLNISFWRGNEVIDYKFWHFFYNRKSSLQSNCDHMTFCYILSSKSTSIGSISTSFTFKEECRWEVCFGSVLKLYIIFDIWTSPHCSHVMSLLKFPVRIMYHFQELLKFYHPDSIKLHTDIFERNHLFYLEMTSGDFYSPT